MSNTKRLSEKLCKGCATIKPRDQFPLYKNGPKAGQTASAYCVKCRNARVAQKRIDASGSTEEYKPRLYYKLPEEVKQKCAELYQDAKMSLSDIAESLSVSIPSVQKALREKGVAPRNCVEASQMAHDKMLSSLEKTLTAKYGSKEEREKRQAEKRKQRNRGHKKEQKKRRRAKAREYVSSVLKGAKCHDCPETDWTILQFDHRDPSDKRQDISALVGKGKSIETIKIELAKCDVVCANCHTRRTARMFGSWRLSQ